MPNTEDIKIYFEEGELINKYLESIKKGIEEEQPVLLLTDSDEEIVEDDVYERASVACYSCQREVMNYCPKCGTLDIDTKQTGYWCSYCSFEFTPTEILDEHLSRCGVKTKVDTKYVRCPFCKQPKRSRVLYTHLKICALKNSGSVPRAPGPISISYNTNDLYAYTCHTCKLGYTNLTEYTKHLKSAHIWNCVFCSKIYMNKESLSSHIQKTHFKETNFKETNLKKTHIKETNFKETQQLPKRVTNYKFHFKYILPKSLENLQSTQSQLKPIIPMLTETLQSTELIVID